MQCTSDTTFSMSQLCLEAWSNSINQSEYWIDQNCFPQNSGGPHSEEDCFYKAVATVPPFCIELSAL